MPKEQVYSVDFSQGNLSPWLDLRSWGDMKPGQTAPASSPTSSAEPQGIVLSVTATGSAAGHPSGSGLFVVPAAGSLDLGTRLLMEVEFDRPEGTPPAAPATGSPEPWAVGLSVKFGDERFLDPDPMVAVTCQFRPTGVRLNTPSHLERPEQAVNLIEPLKYSSLTPGRFVLQHHFCGINADRGYTIGYGSLTIGSPIGKDDQRVYSNAGLSTGAQTWIGALGVLVVTIQGVGRFSARLRNFSVWIWK